MKLSILYIDDEAACLDVFRLMFEREFDVQTVTTADEARRLLHDRPFDIVISDQRMPGISGTDFLREVATKYPESYRVLLTGNVTVAETMGDIASGVVHGFVTKPWTEVDMRQTFERASTSFPLRGQGG